MVTISNSPPHIKNVIYDYTGPGKTGSIWLIESNDNFISDNI